MQSPLLIGVDVAKAEVVVACSQNTRPVHSVANTEPALRKFLRSLPPGSSIAMEATGAYHLCLADLAHQLGFVVYVLNPKDMRHYAKSLGLRAKTDQVDARLIARFLAHEGSRLRAYEPPTPEQRQMDQLIRRRAKIVMLKQGLRLSCAQVPALKAETNKLQADFAALLKKIDRQIAALTQTIPQRAEQSKRLRTIVGVGPLVSAWLANLLSRVQFENSDALVAFVGMDPRPFDSGQRRGKRRLSKRGPSEGRRLLFNAAMSASKSKVWAPIYAHYLQLGWPSTAAIMIVARKILRVAFAVFKTHSDFNPQMLGAQRLT